MLSISRKIENYMHEAAKLFSNDNEHYKMVWKRGDILGAAERNLLGVRSLITNELQDNTEIHEGNTWKIIKHS